ncbi:ACR3 family arsenite efflux transporter [Cryobacterium sp. TMT2-15-1]|uniref:ACR3 family arsenite efflux transporter n=1 Tax=Cryobacterium sp. TMT2-15-1 TaxID=1259246 RepID=UPI00106DAB09|nr:ACR3 family arsenite efflux transporter [Cryobacterium sp. TMT2-15-1]TFC58307.1 ACR3 family arsenite efflux transporter [Cryobacterium sp. TMT2-15-1]
MPFPESTTARPSAPPTVQPAAAHNTIAPARLGAVDRLLPVWILAAMALGLLLAVVAPGVGDLLAAFTIGSVSVPIAIGLLVMMYPVLAKVRYTDARAVARDRRLLVSSLVLNWLLGPALMFALAWIFLPDLPEYRTGLIIVGLARCIAMVLIWNDLACGDREAAAFLVALNSVFQVIAFAALGWFYLQVLPAWLGLSTTSAEFSIWAITVSVLVFLGIPLLAGYLSRRVGEATRGRDWYESRFLPKISPFALYGLLFTIVLLFALQGRQVIDRPFDVALIALPLLVYFAVMFAAGFATGKLTGLSYERTTTLAFTAAGNNFELAIAVAIGTFGATSGQALAGIVGPLIEVPALVALVYVALWLRPRLFPGAGAPASVAADTAVTDTDDTDDTDAAAVTAADADPLPDPV